MKKRLISAIIALLIIIPILLTGETIYNITVYILSLIGLRELLNIKATKKELPIFIDLISYIVMSLIIIGSFNKTNMVFTVDYRIIGGVFLIYLLPAVMYHDRSKYSVVDAFFLMGAIFFLGISFSLLILVRNISLNILVYLLLITIITDTYAYLTGMLIGKHKLLEEISPKKTWEGSIGGSLFGTFIGTVFYMTVVNADANLLVIILVTLFLSILGQFGDLAFSAIKRYYGKKDFSNIMPGHGGILDRLDSIIFVLIGFMFFITLI